MNTQPIATGAYMRFDSLQEFVARFATPSQIISLDRIVAGDLVTFECFPKLSPEIRLMIWELLVESRVIVVDLKTKDNFSVGQKQIQEKRPVLLDVCGESRQLVLKRYTSVFSQPIQPTFAWIYTGSPRSVDLRQVLKTLRLPQKGTIVSMPKVITEYMNTHTDKARLFKGFASFERLERVKPFYYFPQIDTVLFKVASPAWGYTSTRIWSPLAQTANFIKNVAFELHHFDHRILHRVYRVTWSNAMFNHVSNDIRYPHLATADLETVTLLLKGDREVLIIRLDDTGKLSAGQWTYQLDMKSEEHKEHMGSAWSGVTWRITLGRSEDAKLWGRLGTWKFRTGLWEQDKRMILSKYDEGVQGIWQVANSYRLEGYVLAPDRQLELVPGAGVDTYYGPP